MKDEVEKIKVRRQIIEIVYEESFHMSHTEKVDKLQKLFQKSQVKAVRAARKNQIMHDELSLMDFEIDESEIIAWRLDRLQELEVEERLKEDGEIK